MADDATLINRFPEMAQGLHQALQQAVKKVAFDVEAAAKGNAAVRTGFMKSAIYTVTADGSDYSAGGEHALPPVGAGDDLTAIIAAGAYYSIYVEMGTYKMAAEPFMTPAAASVEQGMAQAIAAIIAAKLNSLGIK